MLFSAKAFPLQLFLNYLISMEVLFSLWHASYKMTDNMEFHASFCYLYLTLYLSQMALLVEAYPSVLNMKLPLPLLPIYQANPWYFFSTHFYSCVEKSTVRIKCFAQKQNTLTWSGVKPRPLDPKSNTLTIGSSYLLYKL